MRIAVAVLTAALTSSAAAAIEDVDGTLAKLSEGARTALTEALESDLADGRSSRLRMVTPIDGGRVCGLINTKNRMNAYIGYKAFLAELAPSPTIMLDGEEAGFRDVASVSALIKAACR